MTNRESYILGWVYGQIERNMPDNYDHSAFKFASAMEHPLSGFAQIMADAIREKRYTDALNQKIRDAMVEVEIDNMPNETPEPVQPLELQGSWDIGYHKGKSGAPLPPAPFSIAAARERANMSQEELGNALGVSQSIVSRWERGDAVPSAEMMTKIKAILSGKTD